MSREPTVTASISVLVAHPDHRVRALLTGLLRQLQCVDVVGTAGDGPEAVSRFRRSAPQVVLLDADLLGPAQKGLVLDLGGPAAVVVLTREAAEQTVIDDGHAVMTERLVYGRFGPAELSGAIRRAAIRGGRLPPGPTRRSTKPCG